MTGIVETARLVLRRFTVADVEHLVELDSDPQVMRYLTGGKPTPREAIEREVLPGILREYGRRSGTGRWAAIEKSTGEFLGWFALTAPEGGADGELELGYRLRAVAWGKGYATEGSRAMIERAFADLSAARVFAQTMAVNTASRRVMERSGLRLVRVFHLTWDDPIDGTEQGEVEYELRREDWQTRA